MGTTSNGRPWGENTGRVASGVFYGWAIKRGIEAAQRRPQQDDDGDWDVPVDAMKVALLWVLFAGFVLIEGWLMVNASFMTVVNFFDPMQAGNLTYGLLSLLFAAPAIVMSFLGCSAARALIARAEHLPARRGERFLAWRWFPKKWWSLYLVTILAYTPLHQLLAHHDTLHI